MEEGRKYNQKDYKEKDYNIWMFLFIIFILLFLIFFIYNFVWNTERQKEIQPSIKKDKEITKLKNETGQNNILPPINQEELTSRYRTKIEKIIKLYRETKEKESQKEWAKFTNEALDELFNAIVPAQYKDFHLNLVISFNLINQGASLKNKSENFKKGIDKADKTIETWK